MRPRRAVLPVAAVLWLVVAGCIPTTAPQTPEYRAAFYAREVTLRVAELQAATIAAYDAKALSAENALAIVKFTRASALVIDQTPSGWLPAVSTAWAELKKGLPPDLLSRPNIGAAILAVDLLLATVAGGVK